MSKRLLLIMGLVTVFSGILTSTLKTQPVNSVFYGSIYIRADGSVDPASAPVSSVDSITYTFTDDVFYGLLVVERDNIVINGAGHTLSLIHPGQASGVRLTGINNVTIQYMEITGYGEGILLNMSSNISIANILLHSNDVGIHLASSTHNNISGVHLNDNFVGIQLASSHYNNISKNHLMGNYNQEIVIKDESSNNIISGNQIVPDGTGILFMLSSSNKVHGNSIVGGSWGIWLRDHSSNNVISGNAITGTAYYGIQLLESPSNNITGNTIRNSDVGISLRSFSNSVSGNRFHHNNFIDNTQHANIETSSYANFWDDGTEGNYWDNYTGGDPDHDGIGNSPHVVDVNNTDNCPLMGIFTSFSKLGSFGYIVSNSTIEQFRYFESNCTIRIHVSNMTTSQTIGFCRICIPHALLYEPYNVTVNGAEPHHVNYNLADNETHRWIYFNYEHSLLVIIIAPELPSIAILPLSVITTLLATLLYKRRRTQITSS